MRRAGRIEVVYEGDNFVLAQTPDGYGIWEREAGYRRRRGRPIQAFPFTEEGWVAAHAQFATWEPHARPVTDAAQAMAPGRATRGRGRRWLWVAAPLAALAAGGGLYVGLRDGHGSSGRALLHGAVSHPRPVGTGYLATDNDSVTFIQWTDSGGSLSGTAQEVTAEGRPPNTTTTSETHSVSGTLHGSALSVSFDGDPPSFGTLSGDAFTLDFPQPDGTLAPATFHAAPASAFNTAVADLRRRVNRADQVAANAQALAQAEQTVDDDAGTVTSDIGALAQQEAALSQPTTAIPNDLQNQSKDLATTRNGEQKVAAEAQQSPDGNNGQVCFDASQVGFDASQVKFDASQVSYDTTNVHDSLSSLRRSIDSLKADYARYQSDTANVPGYQPSNPPSQTSVAQATATANAAISSALATTNGYLDQANAAVSTAFQYTADAYQAGKCGQPPSAPSPQSHIS